MDLNDYFQNLFGGRSPEQVQQAEAAEYESLKGFYTPSWKEVTCYSHSVSHFAQFGSFMGKHMMHCNDPACKYDHGALEFCTPTLFLRILSDRLNDQKQTESQDLKQLWMSRELDQVSLDPRYIAFRSSFDLQVIQLYALRQSLNDPYRLAKIE